MNILLVHNFYRSRAPGGEDVVVREERRLLESAGIKVLHYYRSNDEMNEHSFRDRWRVLADMNGSRRTYAEVGHMLSTQSVDLVHVHNTFPLISHSIFAACRDHDIPVVQTIHNYRFSCVASTHYRGGGVCHLCTATNTLPAVRHRCYRNSVLASAAVALTVRRETAERNRGQGADRYLALSNFGSRRLQEAGIPRELIRVRPNFVDDLPVRDSLPNNLPSYAVYSGKLAEEKGLLTLLTAWRRLPHIPLKIIGDGPLRRALEKRVIDERLPVIFLGKLPRDKTLSLVKSARLQVVPSEWYEGMPLVILEAWAAAVPVVGSRMGAIEEMLGADERGLPFVPGDALALSETVNRLWRDDHLRERLIANGQQRYRESHTPASGLKSLLAVYEEVLRCKPLSRRPT